jgi:hypothetical protein
MNRWSLVASSTVSPAVVGHTAIWANQEMIVWGGIIVGGGNVTTNQGARYLPGPNQWLPLLSANAPSPRAGHTAIWTGTEMIVWGGADSGNQTLSSGGRYQATAGMWTYVNSSGAPSPRYGHVAVWTGTRMIVWGGLDNTQTPLSSGGIYDPMNDTWAPMSNMGSPFLNGPVDRNVVSPQAAVWTGTRMIVWGSSTGSPGAVYDPMTNTWSPLPQLGAPPGRIASSAVWTGLELVIWGGSDLQHQPTNAGGVYTP